MTPNEAPTRLVIALSCSGGASRQWQPLADALGTGYALQAPEHFGSDWHVWHGLRAFSLRDEAERTISLIDANSDAQIHLVGHSYGGGVAVHAALARPGRIASLSLYEPSSFHLLAHLGEDGMRALAEIRAVARDVCEGTLTGDSNRAMACFIDYWNAPGTWAAMRPSSKEVLRRWATKCPLEFHALLAASFALDEIADLEMPTLILCGEETRAPSRLICDALTAMLPRACMAILAGTGHMGPVTHPREVQGRVAAHITNASGHGARIPVRRRVRAFDGASLFETARRSC